MSAMHRPEIVSIVEELIGRCSGLGSELFLVPAGTKGTPPHQDEFYVETEPSTYASVWIALRDVDRNNGCLWFEPDSHRGSVYEHVFLDGERSARCTVTMSPTVDLPLKAGDALFIHPRLIHGAHDNMSDAKRQALVLTYIQRGAKFRAGNKQKRTEVQLA